MRFDRTFWPAVVLLALGVGLFELTSLDLRVQDCFYDFAAGRWLVDAKAPGPRLAFYDGPKIAIIAVGVGVLVLAIGPRRWRGSLERRALLVALATMASVPALTGAGKAMTNTFCPSEVRRYGGDVPYVKVCSPYPENDRPYRRGRCFPAGHASGGFALVGLAGLARSRRGQRIGIAAALGVGWAMGGYQMLKGAHYLSHTVVTMLVAWLVFLMWRKLFRVAGVRVDAHETR